MVIENAPILSSLMENCPDSKWLGDICRAVVGQDIKLDFGQQQVANAVKPEIEPLLNNSNPEEKHNFPDTSLWKIIQVCEPKDAELIGRICLALVGRYEVENFTEDELRIYRFICAENKKGVKNND